MTLRLKGSNSGDVSIKAPATAGNNTFTLPTSNGSAEQFLKNSGTAGELEFSSMVEDSSGRLLVGHSSSRDVANVAQPKIQIEGTNVSTSTLSVIRNSNDTGGPVLALSKTRGTSTGSSTVVQSGDTAGAIYFSGADGTDVNSYAAWIEAEIDGTPGGNDMPGRLVFSTTADGANSPTERLRLDSSGRLLLGSTSLINPNINGLGHANRAQIVGGATGDGLTVANTADFARINIVRNANVGDNTELGTISFGSESGQHPVERARISCFSDTTGGSGGRGGELIFYTSADGSHEPSARGKIIANGNLTGWTGIYNDTTGSAANVNVNSSGSLMRSTSSAKYKTNVETIEDSYADALLECRPVWYRSLCEQDNPEHGFWGFIAEEVAEIDPRLVSYRTTEASYDKKTGEAIFSPVDPVPEGVQYDRFVPHLVNLIKRQKATITAQQAQIDDLLARVTALEAA